MKSISKALDQKILKARKKQAKKTRQAGLPVAMAELNFDLGAKVSRSYFIRMYSTLVRLAESETRLEQTLKMADAIDLIYEIDCWAKGEKRKKGYKDETALFKKNIINRDPKCVNAPR